MNTRNKETALRLAGIKAVANRLLGAAAEDMISVRHGRRTVSPDDITTYDHVFEVASKEWDTVKDKYELVKVERAPRESLTHLRYMAEHCAILAACAEHLGKMRGADGEDAPDLDGLSTWGKVTVEAYMAGLAIPKEAIEGVLPPEAGNAGQA